MCIGGGATRSRTGLNGFATPSCAPCTRAVTLGMVGLGGIKRTLLAIFFPLLLAGCGMPAELDRCFHHPDQQSPPCKV